MKPNNILFIFAMFAIFFIFVNITVTFLKIVEFNKELSGYSFANVNISINSVILLNMPQNLLDWGVGSVNSSFNNATLYTRGNNTGYVYGGNWSGSNVTGFVVQNLGTVNCSISIRTNKNAHDFFMSASNTNEEYKLNVTNKNPDSCSGGSTLGLWSNVSTDPGGTLYCSQFNHDTNHNEVYVDVLMTIPKDANKIAPQSDTLTIIGTPSF